MPLNPLIPLSVEAPKFQDPTEQMGKMLQVRAQQQSIANNDLIYQQNRKQVDDQDKVEQILRESGGAQDTAVQRIWKEVSPTLASQISSAWGKQAQERQDWLLKNSTDKLDLLHKQYGVLADGAYAAMQQSDPDSMTGSYQRLWADAQRAGIPAKDEQGNVMMPAPDAFANLANTNLPAAQALLQDMYRHGTSSKDLAAAALAKTNQSEATAKDTSSWMDVAGRLGANVTDDATLSGFRKQLADAQAPAAVISNVPTTYDPKTFGSFMDSTRTAEQRALEPALPIWVNGKAVYGTRDQATGRAPLTGKEQRVPPTASELSNGVGGFGGSGGAAVAQTVDALRPDPLDPKSNVQSPVTGMTPNGEFQEAVGLALTGKLPSLGMGSAPQTKAARFALINKAGAMAAAAGVDLPTLQAAYRANSTSLNKLVPMFNATSASATTAKNNLQLALNQSPRVARTDSPLANRYLQWASGQTLTGNPEYTKLETFIYTAAREYAKVTSGAAQSVAGLSDSAAREASKLLNTAQTPDALRAAAEAMIEDMDNVTSGQAQQIAKVGPGGDVVAQFLTGGRVQMGQQNQQSPQNQQQNMQVPPDLKNWFNGQPVGTMYPAGNITYRKIGDGSVIAFPKSQ